MREGDLMQGMHYISTPALIDFPINVTNTKPGNFSSLIKEHHMGTPKKAFFMIWRRYAGKIYRH
jgi:hypothetical protein